MPHEVNATEPELLTAEHTRASRKPPQSLDAWECVVRALFLCSQLSNECSQEALLLLERATNLDPAYAQAHGLKAWITMWRALQGWEDMGQSLVLARATIRRAIAADEDDPWAYLAQAMTAYSIRDNALAMTSLTRAVDLNPNFAFAHGQLGIAHAFGGRGDEGIACVDRALRLSPREGFLGDYYFFYAAAHFQSARYELGLQFAYEAHRARPGHVYPLLNGVACAGHLDDTRAAADLIGDLEAVATGVSKAWAETSSAFVRAEDRGRFVEGLARAGLA